MLTFLCCIHRLYAQVGIGTVTPDSKLEIKSAGSSASTRALHVKNASGNTLFLIRDDGNIGIGTAAPGAALDLKGAIRLLGSNSGFVGLMPPAEAGSVVYTLPSTDGTNGQVLSTNGSGLLGWTSIPSGSGTVTSVGLTMPSVFGVSASPITGSGNLQVDFLNQSANMVFAGPASGSAAQPVFRLLEPIDIPALDAEKITSGILPFERGGTGSSIKNFVDLTTAQTVAGEKTFSQFLRAMEGASVNHYLSLAGSATPLRLNGDAGTEGQVLVSQGTNATPIWMNLNQAATVKSKNRSALLAGVDMFEISVSQIDADDGVSIVLEAGSVPMPVPGYYIFRDVINKKVTVHFTAPFTGYINCIIVE